MPWACTLLAQEASWALCSTPGHPLSSSSEPKNIPESPWSVLGGSLLSQPLVASEGAHLYCFACSVSHSFTRLLCPVVCCVACVLLMSEVIFHSIALYISFSPSLMERCLLQNQLDPHHLKSVVDGSLLLCEWHLWLSFTEPSHTTTFLGLSAKFPRGKLATVK